MGWAGRASNGLYCVSVSSGLTEPNYRAKFDSSTPGTELRIGPFRFSSFFFYFFFLGQLCPPLSACRAFYPICRRLDKPTILKAYFGPSSLEYRGNSPTKKLLLSTCYNILSQLTQHFPITHSHLNQNVENIQTKCLHCTKHMLKQNVRQRHLHLLL